MYVLRQEHDMECPYRDMRVLSQTHRVLLNTMSLSNAPYTTSSESVESQSDKERNEESDSGTEESDEDRCVRTDT